MQALEKIGILEQDEEKGGRRITQTGQRDLDRKYNLVNVGLAVPRAKRTEFLKSRLLAAACPHL